MASSICTKLRASFKRETDPVSRMFLISQYGTYSSTCTALIACVACAVSTASPAFAEEAADASVTAAARTLAVEGVKLAQAERCGEAIDKLQRAEQLHHSPIVLARLGECLIEQGRLVEGMECLHGVSREPLPEKPSEAMREAYASSKSLLEATRDKVATLTIAIDAAPDAEPSVTVDGSAIPTALVGVGRPTDPGEHVIQASAPGYLTTTRKLSLGRGEEQSVVLALVMDPAAARPQWNAREEAPANGADDPTRAGSLQPSAAGSAQTSAGSRLLPAYIAWAAGAVALGIGVGFGAAAISDKNRLQERCPQRMCAAEQGHLFETARSDARISTLGFLTAIAAGAVGTVLFLALDSGAGSERAPATRARVGLGRAELSLRF